MDTYHPVTLLVRLAGMPTYMHLGWIFVVHFFLAGLGGYLLLRELGARRMRLPGRLLYMFSGYLISFIYGGHDGRAMVATVALFLFALHRAIRTRQARWFVLGGVVLGSALLSFQIQSSYYMLLAGGLWGVFLLCIWTSTTPADPRRAARRRRVDAPGRLLDGRGQFRAVLELRRRLAASGRWRPRVRVRDVVGDAARRSWGWPSPSGSGCSGTTGARTR